MSSTTTTSNGQCHTPSCRHNNDPSFRLTRVAECTISGLDLRTRELQSFASTLRFYPDEHILYLYWDRNDFEKYYQLSQGIFVGVTNHRIFKIEGPNIDHVELRLIATVNHQKNGMFHWDKVECRLIDGRTETFGIYQGSTTEYFCNATRTAISQLPRIVPGSVPASAAPPAYIQLPAYLPAAAPIPAPSQNQPQFSAPPTMGGVPQF